MAFITVTDIPFQSLITSQDLDDIHAQITAGLSDGTKDFNMSTGALGTLNLTTLDLGTNTITDGNLTGGWTGITSFTMTGNLIVDTDTLYVNAATDRVGIGRAPVGSDLEVYRASGDATILVTNASNVGTSRMLYTNDNSKSLIPIIYGSTHADTYDSINLADSSQLTSTSDALFLTQGGNTPIYLGTNSNIRMTIDGSGNVTIHDGLLTAAGALTVTGNTTINKTSGNLTLELNNDSHGDNAGIYFNAEDTGGTNRTANINFVSDNKELNFNADEIQVTTNIANAGFYGISMSNNIGDGLFVRGGGEASTTYNALYIGNNTPSELFRVRGDGAVFAPFVYGDDLNGSTFRDMQIKDDGQLGYDSGSSRRFKTNIVDMEDVDWIYKLRPVNFEYKEKDKKGNYLKRGTGRKEWGLIAEEVADLNDYTINYDQYGIPDYVKYKKFTPMLIKALQGLKIENIEQNIEIHKLKSIIKEK